MKKSIFLTSVLAGLLLLNSCASSIATKVERPAELDLRGANSISILPFQTSAYGDDDKINILGLITITIGDEKDNPKKQITNYLTYNLQDALLNSNYLKVVGSKAVQKAIENGSEIPADVYLSGYINRFNSEINAEKTEDDDGDLVYRYSRSVSFTVVYQVIDSATNEVICSKYKEISRNSGKYDTKKEVPAPLDLVESDLSYLVKTIMKQLQPYEETKYLTLLDDKSKNEDMKKAKSLAKDGYLKEALEDYLYLYNTENLFEAGYNAALLMQAMGNLDEAEQLMDEVNLIYKDKKSAKALSDIRTEKKYAEALQNQKSQKANNK